MRMYWSWAALCVLLAAPAPATELVISTGREGGSYYQLGRRIGDKLLVDDGLQSELRVSAGSLENLQQLDDPNSPVNLVFTQADALNHYLQSNPEFATEFVVLGDVGNECAILVARRGGPIERASDLKLEGKRRISVNQADSGSAVTYRYMTELEPGFGNTAAVFVDTMEALVQLKVGGPFASVDAVLFVQRPRRFSKPVQAVLENPEDYQLLAIAPGDLPNAKLPDGSDVYSFERVGVGAERRKLKQELDTFCMRGLLLGSEWKLGDDLRRKISELMLQSRQDVMGWEE